VKLLNCLLTYLCGTTTDTCLRPFEEDLSMSACLDHSTSNLCTLGSGYGCSPHPPTLISVVLDFSFDWGWLWVELFVLGLRVFWLCDQRSAICLSSWHLGHSGCEILYRVRGCTSSCRHHFRFSVFHFFPFNQHPRLATVEQDWADQGLVNGEFVWRKKWRRSTYLQS
jgi:hypothetical protein